MKVLTVSRFFPKGHKREGEPTFFVEKICKSVDEIRSSVINIINSDIYSTCQPKLHTIRMGQRWKVGDDISFRVWSEIPYRSKQIEFLQRKVVNIWNIDIIQNDSDWEFFINGDRVGANYNQVRQKNIVPTLAKNDGLSINDFLSWFKPKKYPFHFAGQIITWSDKVDYTLPENVKTDSHMYLFLTLS